jgi:hypothetical protein
VDEGIGDDDVGVSGGLWENQNMCTVTVIKRKQDISASPCSEPK